MAQRYTPRPAKRPQGWRLGPEPPTLSFVLIVLAGFAAGFLDVLSGGGSIIVRAALGAAGLSALGASASGTVALLPAQVVAALLLRDALAGHGAGWRAREGTGLPVLAAVSVGGGLAGAVMLLLQPPGTLRAVEPWLILFAVGAFARGAVTPGVVTPGVVTPGVVTPGVVTPGVVTPGVVTRGVVTRNVVTLGASPDQTSTAGRPGRVGTGPRAGIAMQAAVAVYGGYIGGCTGLLSLAALTLFGVGDIRAMTTLKIALTALIGAAASLVFATAGLVQWPATITLAVAALSGGLAGVQVVRRMGETSLRAAVIATGGALIVALLAFGPR